MTILGRYRACNGCRGRALEIRSEAKFWSGVASLQILRSIQDIAISTRARLPSTLPLLNPPNQMEVRLLFSTYSTGLSRGESLSPFALAADFSRPCGSDAIGVENIVCPPASESHGMYTDDEMGYTHVRPYCNAHSHRRSSRFRCPGIFRLNCLLYEGG
jgi:hypothetical protein